MYRITLGALCLALATELACTRSRGPGDRKQVENAIQEHLHQAPHLQPNSFNTKVEGIEFHGSKAEALVRFQSKQTPDLAVRVRYTLTKAGDRWEVRSGSPVGGQVMAAPQDQSQPSAPAPVPSH